MVKSLPTLQSAVASTVAHKLCLGIKNLENKSLEALGADSLDIVEIQIKLEHKFGKIKDITNSDTIDTITNKIYERTTNKGNSMAGKCGPKGW